MPDSKSVQNDPIGAAIVDYSLHTNFQDIIVSSQQLDDDIIPTAYLFRKFESFPQVEKTAMQLCRGEILDIGAAAGPHTRYLLDKGFAVTTIEMSPLAHNYLSQTFPKAKHILGKVEENHDGKFDTLLLLMNGIGIAGHCRNVTPFLMKIKEQLAPGGQIICDSTDVSYLYDNDNVPPGSIDDYYGDFQFNMRYNNHNSGWFNWVYLDPKSFQKCAKDAGLKLSLCAEEDSSFLVRLTKH